MSNGKTTYGDMTRAEKEVADYLYSINIYWLFEHPIFGLQTYCSGVWINGKNIVTAKHCVDDGDGNVASPTNEISTTTTFVPSAAWREDEDCSPHLSEILRTRIEETNARRHAAIAARKAAEVKYGYHANHGRAV